MLKKCRYWITGVLMWGVVSANGGPEIELELFAEGLDDPSDIAHAGDERLFLVEQGGRIYVVDLDGNLADIPFLDIGDRVSQDGGERGLLGLAFHPRYAELGYFFVNYTRTGDGATVVSRFELNDSGSGDPDSEKVLLVIDQPQANHNGGDIRFGPDSYLYIAVGDGGGAGDPGNNAQNPENLLGAILRIDVDSGEPYAVPEDNPFVEEDNVEDEIWALGLRNPWRNSFDRLTGDFWIADVGQREIEAVNFESARSNGGKNYGWRCYEGTEAYDTDGCADASEYIFPVFEYEHYGSGCTGSITGGYVYRGALYSGLAARYLAADYCHGDFYWVRKSNSNDFDYGSFEESFDNAEYVSFGEDVYGELYVAARLSGAIYRIKETSECEPVANVRGTDTRSLYDADTVYLEALHHPSLQYQWYKNGASIADAREAVYHATDTGAYEVEVTNPENGCSMRSNAVTVTNLPLYINNNEQKPLDVQMYPNPANKEAHIQGLPEGTLSTIRIYDIQGRSIRTHQTRERQVVLNTEDWPAGIYKVTVTSGALTVTEQLMVE